MKMGRIRRAKMLCVAALLSKTLIGISILVTLLPTRETWAQLVSNDPGTTVIGIDSYLSDFE